MPLRSVKMKRFIFGFQRRVWCPKWTPLSSRFFMLTTATWRRLPSRARAAGGRDRAARLSHAHPEVRGPGVRPRHRTRREDGTEVATAPLQQREEDTRSRSARGRPQHEHTRSRWVLRPGRPQLGRPSTAARHGPGPAARRGRVGGVSAARLLAVLTVLASIIALPPASAAPPPDTARAPWSRPLA